MESNDEKHLAAINDCLERNLLIRGQGLCETALVQMPDKANEVAGLYGRLLLRAKNYDAALPMLERGLPATAFELGCCYAARKEYDKALTYYLKADTYQGYWQAGLLLIDSKELEKALPYFERAAQAGERTNENDLSRCYFKWAYTLHVLGRGQDAQPIYEKALSLGATDQWTYNNLAILYMDAQRLEEARELLLEGIRLFPEEPAGYYNMACACGRQGLQAETMEWVERAVQNGYTSAERIKRLETEADIALVRTLPAFTELLKNLKNFRYGWCDSIDPAVFEEAPYRYQRIDTSYSSQQPKGDTLTPGIARAINITKLEINSNFGLKHLCEEIGELKKLKEIRIRENPLLDLPDALFKLELHHVRLEMKNQTAFPAFLSRLRIAPGGTLTITLNNLKIRAIPDEIAGIHSLTSLEIRNSTIETCSEEIGSLYHLNELTIANTGLKSFPAVRGGLLQLESLSITDNPALASLPPELALLPNLDWDRVHLKKNGFPGTEAEQVFREASAHKTDRRLLALYLALLQQDEAYLLLHGQVEQVVTALNSKVGLLRNNTLLWLTQWLQGKGAMRLPAGGSEVLVLGKFDRAVNEIKESLKLSGARVVSKPTPKTTHVLLGEKPGDLLDQVVRGNVQLLTEALLQAAALPMTADPIRQVGAYPKEHVRLLLLSPAPTNTAIALEMIREWGHAAEWQEELFVVYQYSNDKEQKKIIQLLLKQTGSAGLQAALAGKYGLSTAADKKINEYLESLSAKAGMDPVRMAYAIFRLTSHRYSFSAVPYLLEHGASWMKTEVLETMLSGDGELNLESDRYTIHQLPLELAHIAGLKKLNLSGAKFRELPPVVWQLPALEVLNLTGCKLTKLPAELAQLRQLRQLILTDCSFKELPEVVCSLTQLEVLLLDVTSAQSTQQIKKLPDSLNQLKRLRVLDLTGNALGVLPAVVSELASLEVLCIHDTALTELPEAIKALPRLRVLIASSSTMTYEVNYSRRNQFAVFPPVLLALSHLERLDIDFEGKVPREIRELTKLTRLVLNADHEYDFVHIREFLPGTDVTRYGYFKKEDYL